MVTTNYYSVLVLSPTCSICKSGTYVCMYALGAMETALMNCIKQYGSTVYVGIAQKMTCAPKIAT